MEGVFIKKLNFNLIRRKRENNSNFKEFKNNHFSESIFVIVGIIIFISLFFPFISISVSEPFIIFDGKITEIKLLSNVSEIREASFIYLIFSPVPNSRIFTVVGYFIFALIALIIFLGIIQSGSRESIIPSILISFITIFLIFWLQNEYIAIHEGYKNNYMTLEFLTSLDVIMPILYVSDNSLSFITPNPTLSKLLICLSVYTISLKYGFYLLLTLMITICICAMTYIVIEREKLKKLRLKKFAPTKNNRSHSKNVLDINVLEELIKDIIWKVWGKNIGESMELLEEILILKKEISKLAKKFKKEGN